MIDRVGRLTMIARIALVACLLSAPASRADEVDPAVLKAEAQRVAVVERASSAAVAVMALGGQGGGSAVVISPDGYALSNFHVTSEAGTAMKCGMADGRLYDAVIVGTDPTGDVALLRLLGRDDFPFAEMADSDKVRVGDWCFAIGNPFLLATDFKPTVSFGVISGVHRYQFPAGTLLEYTDCLQADAAINPGNSGGPMFDGDGKLIGINGRGSFEKRGRVNVGVGYAISINQIKNFLGHLKSGRIVDHATLGASVATNADGRVLVDDILEDSDAARRGLRYGDEVVAFAGRPITSANALKNVLGIFPKGWRVPLSYRRKTDSVDILVRLAGVHREAELAALLQSESKGPPKGRDRRMPRKGKQRPAPKPDQPPPDQPQPPGDPHHAGPHKAEPMPEIVKQHYKARPGYVNYYFNQLNQDRVWKAATAHGDFATTAGVWTLAGELAGGGDWKITLDDASTAIELPGGQLHVDMTGALEKSPEPTGSGGLLVALGLWRKLFIGGPAHFGQVYYQGTAPIYPHLAAGPTELQDVLVGTHRHVEIRAYFNPADGQLSLLEMLPDENADPCEVYFSQYQEVQGRLVPHRLEIRYGDGIYQVLQCKTIDLQPAAEKP